MNYYKTVFHEHSQARPSQAKPGGRAVARCSHKAHARNEYSRTTRNSEKATGRAAAASQPMAHVNGSRKRTVPTTVPNLETTTRGSAVASARCHGHHRHNTPYENSAAGRRQQQQQHCHALLQQGVAKEDATQVRHQTAAAVAVGVNAQGVGAACANEQAWPPSTNGCDARAGTPHPGGVETDNQFFF